MRFRISSPSSWVTHDDFVQAFGQLGDKGCDGYLVSTGQVFQCYGAMNGETHQVARLTKKMKDDFATAKTKLTGSCRNGMVLNLVDGLPMSCQALWNRRREPEYQVRVHQQGFEGVSLRGRRTDCIAARSCGNAGRRQEPDVATLKALVNELVMTDLPPSKPISGRFRSGSSHNELPWHWQLLCAAAGRMHRSSRILRAAS
jgi:hypothetical protein